MAELTAKQKIKTLPLAGFLVSPKEIRALLHEDEEAIIILLLLLMKRIAALEGKPCKPGCGGSPPRVPKSLSEACHPIGMPLAQLPRIGSFGMRHNLAYISRDYTI